MQFLASLFKDGWNALFPLLWSMGVTLICTVLFLIIRRWRGIQYSAGTDLFAMFLAADISVYFGVVEVWRLTAGWSAQTIGNAAVILAVITVLTCWVAVEHEMAANQAHQKWKADARQSGLKSLLYRDYIENLVNAWTARWLIAALHFWWIITRPRWATLT